MLKVKHLFAALLLFFVFNATVALATPMTIDFDVDGLGAPIAPNTPITDQYANLGVTFLGLENGAAVDINAAPDPDGVAAPSAPNVMTNCSDATLTCPGNRADVVQILFASAVSGVSLELDSLGPEAVTFNLYDAADILLETQTVSSGVSLYVPVAFTAAGVSRIDGLQPDDGWGWAFDNLTYSSAVPEPATLVLLGLGIAGIGYQRRKKIEAA